MRKIVITFFYLLLFIYTDVFAVIAVEKAVDVASDVKHPFRGELESIDYPLSKRTEPKIIVEIRHNDHSLYISFTGIDLSLASTFYSSQIQCLTIEFADTHYTIKQISTFDRKENTTCWSHRDEFDKNIQSN